MSLTPLQLHQIADAYARGEKIEWIAEVFNTSATSIVRIAKARGLRRRARRTIVIHPDKALLVVADYQAGASIRHMREKYGVSTYAIREMVRRAGVDPRPRGHPPGPSSQAQP